ncbi:MAG TPA: IS66 family transposase [Pirellulales bacterium]|jgi:transposase|nr:IS66 family transposase [Pirellulales bacterium]
MQDAHALPDDLAACQALLVEQARALVDLQATREQLSHENEELTLAIQKLLARLYGRRSERQADDPAQQRLEFDQDAWGDDPAVQDGLADAAAEAQRLVDQHALGRRAKPRKHRNEQLPAHLPRYEVTAEVPPHQQRCQEHGARQVIGYDVTETLEFERPKLRVRVTKYPKLACPGQPECGVVQPPRPAGLVEGNRYDTGIAAEIVAAKYAYHLPTYRQQDWFAGSGWMPGRSTLLNIMSSSAYVLEPLYLHYADWVRTSPVIPTDETGVMLLLPPEIPAARDDPKSQQIHEVLSAARAANKSHVSARMWVYRSLGAAGANVFDFQISRRRDGPQEFLRNYTGTLLGDCYAGFESIVLASDSRIVRAACHAHARRKLFEARQYHPLEVPQLLAWYRQLYDVEDQARGGSPEAVLTMRQQLSVPIMGRLRAWLDGDAARQVLPKSPLGEALRYLNNQWEALSVFLGNGRVPIDNNETEQLMKQVATGRKNWLFIGSVEAGYRAAILMTMASTAHRYHLDIWLYLKDVLDRLLGGERDLAALRADRWALEHPTAIRPYRVDEVRYRAESKAVRRAHRRLGQRQRSGQS